MERSGGSPYAMVYVRDNQIESFAYPYFLNKPAQQLLEVNNPKADYYESIPNELCSKII